MRKIMIFFLFFYIIFIFPRSINAQWQKYSNNPVIDSSLEQCNNVHSSSPSVIHDQGIFKMWYQGFNGSTWNICYATSIDGKQWIKENNPVISTSNYNELGITEVTEPTVIKNNNIYKVWFKDRKNNKNRIRYGTSDDGIVWNILPQPVLEGTLNSWDFDGPTNPYVYYDGNKYYLWYTANNGAGGSWQAGYATSVDGIVWQKNNNPLSLPTPAFGFIGGISVLPNNGNFYMWYHVGSQGQNIGIYETVSSSLENQQWLCINSCEIISRTQETFDQSGIVAPDVVKVNNQLYLYYGAYDGGHWRIGLAINNLLIPTEKPVPTPTAIPIPTPTSTPTTSPVPTPTLIPENIPIVIIPGMFASWNKEAIIHNQPAVQNEWKIAQFINEYYGIIDTLKNLGYQENKDLFIFPYDWRKNIEQIAEDFNQFQQIKIKNHPFSIIGHSLGGLVGRIWLQKYSSFSFDKLVTIGSPHLGTAQVYKSVESGDIDKQNNILWLAEKIIININKNIFDSDKETLAKLMPVLNNLLPVYSYIQINNSYILIDSMQIKNNLLFNYSDISRILPNLYTISSQKGQTLFGFRVKAQTNKDKFLNIYPDGRPIEEIKQFGDEVILESSANIGNQKYIINLNHGELIYKKEAIKKILDILNINYSDDKIVEGKGTIIEPSLIFLLKSPATMKVVNGQKIYADNNDGIIFIPNAQAGDYRIEIKGINNGQYTLISGQIGTEADSWSEITEAIKTNETNYYNLSFDSKKPKKKILKHKNHLIDWCKQIFDAFIK